jgi:hypothetical protein
VTVKMMPHPAPEKFITIITFIIFNTFTADLNRQRRIPHEAH